MKLYKCLLLLITIFLISCEKDPLINCNCTLPYKDMLCKTYLFENDKCVGYIDYSYNTQLQKETEDYLSVKGKVEKTISYTYNSLGFISEKKVNTISPAKTERISYTYNTSGKLEKLEQLENEVLIKSKTFLYNDSSKLQQIKIYSNGVIDSLISFEYDCDGKLWRESFFNKDSSLSSYQIHQFYFNDIESVNLFNANDVYLGYNLWVHDSGGKIISYAEYNQTNDLVNKTTYTYENNLLVKETTIDGFGKVISYNVYFYS